MEQSSCYSKIQYFILAIHPRHQPLVYELQCHSANDGIRKLFAKRWKKDAFVLFTYFYACVVWGQEQFNTESYECAGTLALCC